MALIKCPGCGNMISSQAPNCPRCGCPVGYSGNLQYTNNGIRVPYKKNNNSEKWLYAVLALLLTLLLGFVAYLLFNKDKGAEGNTPTTEVVKSDPATSTTSVKQESVPPSIPSTSAKQETQPAAVRNKVANGTYYLSGAITHKQTYYIDMEVNVSGNQATGRYIVRNGENVFVTLSGTIDSKGNMKLTEYKSGQPTGYYFTGQFNQAVYSGTYRCTTRKLTMKFSASTY